MTKEIFKNLVSRYYPDCSDVQVVTTQQSFNEECKKFNIQYEPKYKMSGGVILDGVMETTNFEPCFKICVNIPVGVRGDFERFLNCVASLYALCNLRDSGNYRGGKVEIYRKEHYDDEHFIHYEDPRFGIDDTPGIDAYNYKFNKTKREFEKDDFKFTVDGYSKFNAFEYTSEEDLLNRLKQWYNKVQVFKK